MSKVFGEVIATPNSPKPFASVFYFDDKEIDRCEADSYEEANVIVMEMLSKLADIVRQDANS